MKLPQAAGIAAGAIGLHGVFGADAVLGDAGDMRHFQEARGDAGVRGGAAIVNGIEVGMCVELNDVDGAAENGKGFADGNRDGVVAAGEEGNFSGAPLRGSKIAKAPRCGRPIGLRRKIASVIDFSGEIDTRFTRGAVAIAVISEADGSGATSGAATERGLRIVGEAGENKAGGSVLREATGKGNRHGGENIEFERVKPRRNGRELDEATCGE